MQILRPASAVLVVALLGVPAAAQDWVDEETARAVDQAKARAGEIPEQARALAMLAWPDGDNPSSDPRVRAFARRQIVGFGDRGIDAMRERFRLAPARYGADIASALAETRLIVTAGLPAQYLPALYDMVWYGSPDAKRIAMVEIARFRYSPALLTIIDAAYEYPRLLSSAIDAVGQLGDDRARFFLGEVLSAGKEPSATAAAEALARIGGGGIQTLRDATQDPREAIRATAIDALIPVSRVEDLTILYEYLQGYADRDDSRRVEIVMQRARQLESMLEARQYGEDGEEQN